MAKCVICVFAHQQVLITARNLKTISYFVGVFPIESMNQFDAATNRESIREILDLQAFFLLKLFFLFSVFVLFSFCDARNNISENRFSISIRNNNKNLFQLNAE